MVPQGCSSCTDLLLRDHNDANAFVVATAGFMLAAVCAWRPRDVLLLAYVAGSFCSALLSCVVDVVSERSKAEAMVLDPFSACSAAVVATLLRHLGGCMPLAPDPTRREKITNYCVALLPAAAVLVATPRSVAVRTAACATAQCLAVAVFRRSSAALAYVCSLALATAITPANQNVSAASFHAVLVLVAYLVHSCRHPQQCPRPTPIRNDAKQPPSGAPAAH